MKHAHHDTKENSRNLRAESASEAMVGDIEKQALPFYNAGARRSQPDGTFYGLSSASAKPMSNRGRFIAAISSYS
jgi:hypothetical protein